MSKKTHEQLKEQALKRPGVRKAYEALDEEFQLLNEMLHARLNAGLTQGQVAEAMGTTTSVVGRLETGGGRHKHSPTVETLRKFAKAVDCRVEIKFVELESKGRRSRASLVMHEEGEEYRTPKVKRSKAIKKS